MRTHLVTYTLHAPEQNYTALIDAIKRYPKWCRLMPATWQVQTTDTPGQIRDKLKRHVSSNDQLYVVDITGKASAWFNLTSQVGSWIKDAA